MKSLIPFVLCISLPALADQPAPAAAPPPPASAAPTCFQLSATGKTWSRTPELLCIGGGTKNIQITLTSGIATNATQIASFQLDLAKRARCIDCNHDEFALTNPSNSVFNALAIKFNGKRDTRAGTESGTVSIGKTRFHYRKTK